MTYVLSIQINIFQIFLGATVPAPKRRKKIRRYSKNEKSSFGDFYEILGKDAVTIASELDLTLTGRECGLTYRIPMVGFPYHAAEVYFGKIARKHNLVIRENDKDIQLIDKINIDDNRLIDQDTGEILNQKDFKTDNMIKTLYSIFGNNIEVKL